MIGISTQTYDLSGARIFKLIMPVPVHRAGSRRIMRTATLDGGVTIADMGYSDGDRTFTIEIPDPRIEDVDFARYIVETFNLVTVVTDDGVYSVAPSTYKVLSNGKLSIELLVKQKTSQ